jgi:hypothetical protein
MFGEVTSERVAVIATAARIPLDADSSARVARAVTPAMTRFAAADISIDFEVEPSTFATIARADIGR